MIYRLGWWVAFFPMRLFYRVKIFGKKNFIKKGKCVGICNHYTMLDVPIVAVQFYRRLHFIAKKELYRKKSAAWLFRHLGAIKIDRDTADIGAMKAALKVLKEEEMLMLFPEGTRNKTGEDDVQNVKAGAALFAIKGKAPVVPMVLYRPPKAFRKNYLMIGKPFSFEALYGKKLTQEDMDAAAEKIHGELDGLKRELDALVARRKDGKRKKAQNGGERKTPREE